MDISPINRDVIYRTRSAGSNISQYIGSTRETWILIILVHSVAACKLQNYTYLPFFWVKKVFRVQKVLRVNKVFRVKKVFWVKKKLGQKSFLGQKHPDPKVFTLGDQKR